MKRRAVFIIASSLFVPAVWCMDHFVPIGGSVDSWHAWHAQEGADDNKENFLHDCKPLIDCWNVPVLKNAVDTGLKSGYLTNDDCALLFKYACKKNDEHKRVGGFLYDACKAQLGINYLASKLAQCIAKPSPRK